MKILKPIKWAILLPAFILFLGIESIQASHILGGEAYYTCLGNNQYSVTFVLYRDCSGISMPTSLSVTVGAPDCGITNTSSTLNPGAVFGTEVTPLCPAQATGSTCVGGSTFNGIRKYEYTGIITLPSACDSWVIGWATCCRNAAVTNGTAGSMYIETRINNTNGLCNNSARFASIPIPFLCSGQPFNFSFGAYDADGDQLIYELITPMLTSPTTFFAFSGSFTATQPLTTSPAMGVVLDSTLGQISFTPSGNQVAVSAIRVYEIRNGDTVGITMRDMQYIVVSGCTNQGVTVSPTQIAAGTNFNASTQTFTACVCDTVNFVVSASDPNSSDSLRFSANLSSILTALGASNVTISSVYPIPGRTDTIDVSVQIRTCNLQPGDYNFNLTITDNGCPFTLPGYSGYRLVVPGVNILEDEIHLCAGIADTIALNAMTFGTGTSQWTQISGPASSLSNNNILNPLLYVPASTNAGDSVQFRVQYTVGSCIAYDTVSIYLDSLSLDLMLMASDTALCQNGLANIIQFNSAVSGANLNFTNGTFNWSAIPAARIADLSSVVISNPLAALIGVAGDSLQYIVQYNYGICAAQDTVSLRFKIGSTVVTPVTDTICQGDTIQLSAMLTDTFFSTVACGYQVTSIPFAPVTGTPINTGLGCDDCLSAFLPIGFNFDFYCNTYTQFKVGANGFMSFNSNPGTGCCSGQNIPNPTAPNDLIALAWTDLNVGSCGSITYFTGGTAPNRHLVVNFNGVCLYGSAATVTVQAVLYETSNIIELHTTSISGLPGSTTQGTENATGTIGNPVPGHNSTVFTASNQAYRFSPIGYQFGFAPITYQWSPDTSLLNALINNPLAFPLATTTYQVTVSERGCALQDSITITVNPATVPTPVISCGNPPNPDDLLYHWSGSSNVTGWAYSLDSGLTFTNVSATTDSLYIPGIGYDTCLTIMVRAFDSLAACQGSLISGFSCCTPVFCNDSSYIQGRVVIDNNSNCIADPSEIGIIGTMVYIQDVGNSFYTNVYNQSGAYLSLLDSGICTITASPPNPYWQLCSPTIQVDLDTVCNSTEVDFVLQDIIACPYMTVDLSVPILRKTQSSFYTVSYCNSGTVAANNVSIEVDIDPFLNILSSSIPIDAQTGNLLVFNIGTVGVAQCGSFTIEVIVDSTTALGMQAHCSSAHIYPDSVCVPGLWNGPEIDVIGLCQNDTVLFIVENNAAAMPAIRNYYIYENDTMIVQNTYQLAAGANFVLAQPARLGKTYRLIAEQAVGYPAWLGDSTATDFVENCNISPGVGVSTGFGLQFSNGNSSPYIAMDCVENVSAFDPNDKKGQPEGYNAAHYIYDYTNLDYTIRFQNTGTDTAFNVVILDTLPSYLDVSSIQMGSSSHALEWVLLPGNVLRVSFNNILLPASVTNEPLSHGFFKFHIRQKPGNPIGTIIYNSASIYFDSEAPVMTNTTFHEIGNDFEIEMIVISGATIIPNLQVLVYPNPFSESTDIIVSGQSFQELELFLYDVNGQLLKQIRSFDNRLKLNREGLSSGLYFYRLTGDGVELNNGKVVVK